MKRLLLIALGTSSLAYGQKKDNPPKHVRFIPLGELPVWAEDLKEGIRVQRKAEPGAKPPPVVTFTGTNAIKNLRLTLRSFSDLATFPGTAEGILLKEGKGAGGKAFLKSALPASALSLGVLFLDPANMTWEDAKIKMLPDDAKAFPPGNMRFVNVSDCTVVVQMAGVKPFGIKPGKTSLKPLKDGSTPIKVGYVPEGGGSKAIWQNNVKLLKGQRVQCFFYKAQGKNPRDAVKFHYVAENVPKPPRPPKGR